jgi:predicted MFS family arabinose efflux permease
MGLRYRLAARLEGRLYYGWIIVGLIYTSNLAAFSVNSTFGLFVTPLEQEFGWSRATLARSLTLGTVFGAGLAPLLGALIDRVGLRRLMVWGGLFSSLCYAALSFVQQAWQYNVLLGLCLGVMNSGIGQVMGSVAVSRWFVRRRGRAMGIVMMGASSSGLLFVTLHTVLIATLGWRAAYQVQAALTALLIAGPAFLLMIEQPEAVGVSDSGPPVAAPGAVPAEAYDWTIRQAVRTRAFWMTLLGVMLGSFTVMGYFAHAVPILESHGYPRSLASTAWAVFFVTGILAKFVWGFAIERLSVRYSLLICMLAEAAGLVLLLSVRSPTGLFIWAVLTGLGHGPFLQLLAMVWADYFGRKSIGRLYGVVQPFVVIGGSLGPWMAGLLFDARQSYETFLLLCIALVVTAAVVFALDPPPGRPAVA